jgi:hypothetical protein
MLQQAEYKCVAASYAQPGWSGPKLVQGAAQVGGPPAYDEIVVYSCIGEEEMALVQKEKGLRINKMLQQAEYKCVAASYAQPGQWSI